MLVFCDSNSEYLRDDPYMLTEGELHCQYDCALRRKWYPTSSIWCVKIFHRYF